MSLTSALQTAFTRVATEFNTVRDEIAGASGAGTPISDLPAMTTPPAPDDVFVGVDTSTVETQQVSAYLVNLSSIGLHAGIHIAQQLS